ncbi:response regulator [Candidatus Methylomirabilis sp.]|uniref:response regulator n=1 Tax=Candidatus Methylomirabilis sp. TaxID=2032687 RepID=UPI002A5BE757|nr:response regulator [Candidatus Methylomirabilis sp.]
MEELTIKSLSAVMAVSARGRSFTLDQLLGTALEELLKALDDTVLGWICLAHEQLPDGLIEPAVTKLRSAPEQKSTPIAKLGRILVIDDDEFVRTLLSDVLRAAGHTVVQAAGGKEGLHRFHQGGFDLVLTDLGMPECSGWEVAAAVKKMAPQTPVALITGWELTLDRGKLKEAGVDLVLNKPFHVVEVRRLVAEALTLRETI